MAARTLNIMSRSNMIPFRFNSIYARSQDVAICLFSDSQISPHTRLSQIHSHDTSQKFIYTSKFYIFIVTLTKMGEC